MKTFSTFDAAALFVASLSDGDLKLALPLGLGKPNQLANRIYQHFKKEIPSRRLEIYTALSLDVPTLHSDLEKRLLNPFLKRHFGENYPRLDYVKDQLNHEMPKNISVHEFYFMAGQYLKTPQAQQNYISLNYTHAAQALMDRGLQIVLQLVARQERNGKTFYSLSCNPDMTLDVVDLARRQGRNFHVIGVVHPDLPFLGGDAEVSEEFFSAIVDTSELKQELFALPRNSIDFVDHMIGMHASRLVEDGGTLQIGIGSLSDALVNSIILRHKQNSIYRKIVEDLDAGLNAKKYSAFHKYEFSEGLYATSEMVMDGFMHLRKAGVLKRFIFDEDEHRKRYLHGAFFLGSKEFYKWLKNLAREDYEGLSMTRVSKVNDLYDSHEMALRRQRKKARFFNTCMKVNLLGGVVSDTLENGNVVSGVGGQYNFVAMSQELNDSHSVLMLRSTRNKSGKRYSNITSENGQLTISRHLRDIVVTEYGVAFLKGKTDAEVIAALIEISDSEFQAELLEWAKKNGKIQSDYKIPTVALANSPNKISELVERYRSESVFSETPFGSDFSDIELKLVKSLSSLKEKSKIEVVKILFSGFFNSKKNYQNELERLDLYEAKKFSEWLMQSLVKGALASA